MPSATLTDCIHRISALVNSLQQTPTAVAALELQQCLEILVEVQQQQQAEAQVLKAEITECLQLKAERSRLIAILEASADYIATATSQGDVLWNNPQLRKIRGLSLDAEVTHLQIADYHPQWALDMIQQQGIPTAIRDGIWLGETALLDEYEQEIPVSQMILAHKSAEGTVEYLSTVMRDISDQKRAEIALHKREQEFRALVDNSPDHVARLDRDGRILYINPAATQITGLLPEHYIGKTSSELGMPEDCNQLWTAAVQQVFETRHEVKIEFEYPSIQGIAHFQTRYIPELNLTGEVETVLALSRDITELKQTQAQLQETNNVLEAVIQSAPIAIDLLAPDGTVLLWNRIAEEILGWSAAEVIGKPPPTAPDAQQHEFQEFLQNTLAGKTLSQVETRRQRKDGSWVDIRLSTAPIKDAQGQVIGGLGIAQDITEQPAVIRAQQQAEAALHESEQRFRSAFEAAAIGMCLVSMEGWYLEANRSMCQLFGYSQQELLTLTVQETTYPEDLEVDLDLGQQLLNGEIPYYHLEKRYLHKQGHIIWGLLSVSLIRDLQQKPLYFIAQVQDISDQKLAEEKLWKTQQHLQAILDYSPALIYLIDRNNNYLFINRRYETLVSTTQESLIGKSIYEVWPTDICDAFAANNQQILHSGEPMEFEEVAPHADGLHTYITIKFPLYDANGVFYAVGGISADITERKRAEEAHRRSEARFRGLMQTSPDIITLSTSEGGVFYQSPAVERILGYAPEELVGELPMQVLHPDDRENLQATITRMLANPGVPIGIEYRLRHKNGSWVWLEGIGTNLLDEPDIQAFVVFSRDIRDRKLAEEKLQASQHFIQKIADASPNLLYLYDLEERRNIYVNREITQMLGYTPEEVQAMGKELFPILMHPDDLRASPEKQLEIAVAADGDAIEFEYRMRHKNGEWLWLYSWDTVFARNADGKPTQVLGTATDISDRKHLELALKQSEVRFRTCVENLLDPLALFSSIRDATGQIVDLRYEYINPAGCQSNRLPKEAMLGKPMFELFPILRDIGLFDAYRGVVETGASWIKESVFLEVMVDGQPIALFFDIQAVKLGDGLMVTWRDVTERQRAEKQIQASLQEKEVLLKEIHHRVKNNLQVILSLLKLQSSYTTDPQTLQMFQESQNRIRSMALIHELLYQSQDLARIDFGSYIHTLVNQLARTYTVSTGAIAWEINVEPPVIQLTIDTALPCGLLINELVSNALKYAFPTGQPGTIRISLQACNNQEFLLVISDNGLGISSDLDFRHTDSLGLQLVCGTTAQLGGTIELDRTQGTTFTIRFKEVKYKARR